MIKKRTLLGLAVFILTGSGPPLEARGHTSQYTQPPSVPRWITKNLSTHPLCI